MMKLSVSVPHPNLYYTTRLMPVLYQSWPCKVASPSAEERIKEQETKTHKIAAARKEKTIPDLHPLYFVQITFQPMTEPSLISISIFVTFGADMDLTLSEPMLPTWMYGIALTVTKKIKNKKS